jgi:hypothetical protein
VQANPSGHSGKGFPRRFVETTRGTRPVERPPRLAVPIGAREPSRVTVQPPDAPFGDLDENGFVDTGDIAILLLLFG